MRTFLTALADRRHPVLRWEGSSGASLELTGPVLANWVHKAHGLLADTDVGPDLDLGIVDGTGLHWRALAGALATWSLGGCVRIITDEEPDSPWAALASEDRAADPVTRSADELLVFPVAPLALGVDAPPDTIDFATALRAYPDEAPMGTTARVAFGDATTTVTEDLRVLCAGASARAAAGAGAGAGTAAGAGSGAQGDLTTAASVDSVSTAAAPTATTTTATTAEVVVTAAPLTASDWGRVMHGLLHGVVVFRTADS